MRLKNSQISLMCATMLFSFGVGVNARKHVRPAHKHTCIRTLVSKYADMRAHTHTCTLTRTHRYTQIRKSTATEDAGVFSLVYKLTNTFRVEHATHTHTRTHTKWHTLDGFMNYKFYITMFSVSHVHIYTHTHTHKHTHACTRTYESRNILRAQISCKSLCAPNLWPPCCLGNAKSITGPTPWPRNITKFYLFNCFLSISLCSINLVLVIPLYPEPRCKQDTSRELRICAKRVSFFIHRFEKCVDWLMD